MKIQDLADGTYTISTEVFRNRWVKVLRNNVVIGKVLLNIFHNTNSFTVSTSNAYSGRGLCKTVTHYNNNGFVMQNMYYIDQISDDSGEDEEEIYFTTTAVQATDGSSISNTCIATQTISRRLKDEETQTDASNRVNVDVQTE